MPPPTSPYSLSAHKTIYNLLLPWWLLLTYAQLKPCQSNLLLTLVLGQSPLRGIKSLHGLRCLHIITHNTDSVVRVTTPAQCLHRQGCLYSGEFIQEEGSYQVISSEYYGLAFMWVTRVTRVLLSYGSLQVLQYCRIQ